MERCTERSYGGYGVLKDGYTTQFALSKLAAYEDIGLTPEEIENLKEQRDFWRNEAKKWCAKLGEIRLLAEGGGDNENNS